jgi:hypothetical protein
MLATRNPAVSDCLRLIVIGIVSLLALNWPVFSEDHMILGPRQFESDSSGAGAVLCAWSICLSIQAETAACGSARRPVYDAMDETIVAIDEFILANSSLHPTRDAGRIQAPFGRIGTKHGAPSRSSEGLRGA